MGRYFAERAGAVAEYLRYVPETEASGVFWEKDGQLLTSSRQVPVRTLQSEAASEPPVEAREASTGGRWVLVAWKEAGETQPEWITAIDGGRRDSKCGGEPYRELIVNSALTREMLGAGVFDLDGVLVGMVARCGSTMHVISAGSFRELVAKFSDAEHRLQAEQGVTVRRVEAGLFVAETVTAGAGYAAGIRAGDVIAGMNEAGQLLAWFEGNRETPLSLRRGARSLNVTKGNGAGVEILPAPPPALYVEAGSAAHRVGLRTGDGLVQPSLAELRRLLAPGAKAPPTLLVYEREGVQFARMLEVAQ